MASIVTTTIRVPVPKRRLPMAPGVRVHRDRRTKRQGGRREQVDRSVRDGHV